MHYGAKSAADSGVVSTSSASIKWQPPPVSFVKMNTDVALSSSRSLVEIGIVLRDDKGLILGSSGQCFGGYLSHIVIEGKAVLRGLKFAIDVGIAFLIMESNTSSLIGLINGKLVASSKIGLIVKEIQSLCFQFQHCSFFFGSRKVNWVAHTLAKLALSSVSDFFLIDVVPLLVELFVQDDRPE
ncbi:hypothetical protein ACOSQ3_026477 [Xanthoceras sorbifolium]